MWSLPVGSVVKLGHVSCLVCVMRAEVTVGQFGAHVLRGGLKLEDVAALFLPAPSAFPLPGSKYRLHFSLDLE